MRRVSVLLMALLVATAAGCESEAGERSGTDDGAVAPVIVDASEEKQRRRDAQFQDAIAGLEFDTGVIVVEAPPASDDVAAAGTLMSRGEALLEQNHRTAAIAAFSEAIKAAPGLDGPYLALGRALITKGKMEHAYAAFRTVVARDPVHAPARAALANALAMRGRYDEAIVEMRQSLALDPQFAAGHERLAIWSYYEGDLVTAREHVDAAERLGHAMPPQFLALLEQSGG